MGLIRLQSSSLPSGSVLQVKNFMSSTSGGQLVTTSTSTWTASGVYIDFTPISASSLIVIRADLQSKNDSGNTSDGLRMVIMRDTTNRVGVGTSADAFFHQAGTSNHNQHFQMSFSVSETASSTTSRRYEVYLRSFGGNSTGINYDWGAQSMQVMEIAA